MIRRDSIFSTFGLCDIDRLLFRVTQSCVRKLGHSLRPLAAGPIRNAEIMEYLLTMLHSYDIYLSYILYIKYDTFIISRLNSGNFGIFYPDGFYLNLKSSLESALKIIKNDTDITYEL